MTLDVKYEQLSDDTSQNDTEENVQQPPTIYARRW